MSRPNWDQYYMDIATAVSARGTCDRKKVGAVIVQNGAIVATGYNGSITSLDHCDDVGHMMEDGHCVRTIHAEMSAITQAARNGIILQDSTLYTTASPCWPCFKHIVQVGIGVIVFGEFYRDDRIFDAANELELTLIDLSKDKD